MGQPARQLHFRRAQLWMGDLPVPMNHNARSPNADDGVAHQLSTKTVLDSCNWPSNCEDGMNPAQQMHPRSDPSYQSSEGVQLFRTDAGYARKCPHDFISLLQLFEFLLSKSAVLIQVILDGLVGGIAHLIENVHWQIGMYGRTASMQGHATPMQFFGLDGTTRPGCCSHTGISYCM